MKLRVIIVGKDKNDPIVAAADEYVARIQHYFPISVVEVKEEPAKGSTPIDRVRALEAERIRKALGDDAWWVALDERGKAPDSVEMSKKLGGWAGEGRGQVSLVIGGPNGLDPALVASAKERWSLSRLTLPHRIARLVLCEQLYRACTILRGEPYHK